MKCRAPVKIARQCRRETLNTFKHCRQRGLLAGFGAPPVPSPDRLMPSASHGFCAARLAECHGGAIVLSAIVLFRDVLLLSWGKHLKLTLTPDNGGAGLSCGPASCRHATNL